MSAPSAVLELSQVSKGFRIPSVRRDTVREHVLDFFRRRPTEQLRVLDNITLHVRRGETLGVMGRNGCGKSTLLKIMAGIYVPDSGYVRTRASVTPILELGLGWNPDLDAIDNVLLIGTVMGLSIRDLKSALEDILTFAGVERFANLQLRHFSSGMAARLAYAVAFTAVKEVLILDEIFAVGDAEFRERCETRYRTLSAAGHTVVLVSHNPQTVATFCDRAVLVEGGHIVAEGPGSEIADAYRALLGAR